MHGRATYDGEELKFPNACGQLEGVGGLLASGNLRRLIAAKRFLYETEGGRISVRLERKARGSSSGYWFAYKRWRGKLLKMYLCEAYALEPFLLDRVARRLLG